jgi:hypothetical protein
MAIIRQRSAYVLTEAELSLVIKLPPCRRLHPPRSRRPHQSPAFGAHTADSVPVRVGDSPEGQTGFYAALEAA